jgi:hypothetical protein
MIMARGEDVGAVAVTVPTRRAQDVHRHLGFVETATYLKQSRTTAGSTFR